METPSFWFSTLAVAALVWGLLGLRFGLSVLAAGALFALLLRLLPDASPDNATGQILLLCYPVYWGAAFLLLRFLDLLPLPPLPAPLRVTFGLLLALGFGVIAGWDTLRREGRLAYAAYLSAPERRPALIADVFARMGAARVCGESYATLMRLAVSNRDEAVVRVLLRAFERCRAASATMVESVRPLFDKNDADSVAFLLHSGLEPSSLVFGADYANGTALAYAACQGKEDLVRLIVRRDPEGAARLRYLPNLFEALRQKGDERMAALLREEGLKEAPSARPEGGAAP